MVRYGGTVRNSQGDVVQFLYGEDGMDAVRIESQSFEYLKWDVSTATGLPLNAPPCAQARTCSRTLPTAECMPCSRTLIAAMRVMAEGRARMVL